MIIQYAGQISRYKMHGIGFSYSVNSIISKYSFWNRIRYFCVSEEEELLLLNFLRCSISTNLNELTSSTRRSWFALGPTIWNLEHLYFISNQPGQNVIIIPRKIMEAFGDLGRLIYNGCPCSQLNIMQYIYFLIKSKLEDTARYAGLLLAPAESFGLWPRLFLPFGQKKSLLCCFGPFLAIFGVQ